MHMRRKLFFVASMAVLVLAARVGHGRSGG